MNNLMLALDDYLTLRRRLGFKLKEHATALRAFINFLHAQGAEFVSTQLALNWAQQPREAQPAHRAHRLGMARDFARFLQARDPRTEIPPSGLLAGSYRRITPYIYTADQILRLVEEASGLSPACSLRPCTQSTVFGLLAVTGMRISEILMLNRNSVDLTQGILAVKKSKFGKSRFIPLHDSTKKRLQNYVRQRDRLVPAATTDAFFISDQGARLKYGSVLYTFLKLSRRIGLRGPSQRHGPRLHDLRHTFAVRTLTHWYQAGLDPEQRIPWLSAYLGHAKVSDTYWYLSAVPELMGAVTKRLERFMGGLS